MTIPPIFPARPQAPTTPASINVVTTPLTPATPEQAKPQVQQLAFSPEEFQKIKTRSEKMVSDLAERDAQFKLEEQAFLIEPGGSSVVGARQLFDTSAHTAVTKMVGMFLGKQSMMPTINVRNNQRGDPDKVEKVIRGLLEAQSVVSSSNWIGDGFYSFAIFGEGTAVIHKLITGDAVADAAIRVPFVFKVPHPSSSYPVYSSGIIGGLYRHVFKVITTLGEVQEDYAEAKAIEGDPDEIVTVYDYMDRVSRVHCVWIQEHADNPVRWANLPAGLQTMPRACRLSTDAPGFFVKEKDRRHGLLSAFIKSGLWAALNTLWSVMYSNIFDYIDPDIEIHGETIERAKQIDEEMDFESRPMKLHMTKEERIAVMAKQLIPPEITTFIGVTSGMKSDVLIPPIAGGTPPDVVTAAAGLNIMSENANRAVNYLADVMGFLVGDVLNDVLQWARAGEYVLKVWTENGVIELQAGDIGDCIVTAKFQPDRTAQQQIIMGIASEMARLHLGEDDILPLLEQVQLIDSSSEAKKRMYESAVDAAERAMVGQSVIAEVQRLNQAITQVGQPNIPQGAPPSGAPPSVPQANPALPTLATPPTPSPVGVVPPKPIGQ